MLVLVTLALLTPFFADLPKATLAAVVIAAVLPLLKTASLRRLYRIDKADFSIALVCLSGVLVLGVLGGIVVAVVASLVALVHRSFRPEVAVLGRSRSRETDEDIGFRDVSRHRDVETFPGLVIFRFDQEIFFANATFFRDQIRQRRRVNQPAAADDPRRRRRRHPHRHDRHRHARRPPRRTVGRKGISLGSPGSRARSGRPSYEPGSYERFGPESFYRTVESGVAAFVAGQSPGSPAAGC